MEESPAEQQQQQPTAIAQLTSDVLISNGELTIPGQNTQSISYKCMQFTKNLFFLNPDYDHSMKFIYWLRVYFYKSNCSILPLYLNSIFDADTLKLSNHMEQGHKIEMCTDLDMEQFYLKKEIKNVILIQTLILI